MKTIENKQAATPSQTTAPATIERRYDVDWLRVIAVFSVLALHSAVIFSFGQFIVQHTQPPLTLDTIDIYLSIWVIPLLFVLAGAATKFSLDRRTPKEYRSERVKRLLLPFVIWFIVPLVAANVFGWDFLFQLPGNPRFALGHWYVVFGTGHLWFIFYLFLFSLIALPLFIFLRKPTGVRIISWLAHLCEKPGVIFLLAVPLMGISSADNDNNLLRLFYLSEAIYPLYILHYLILGLIGYYIAGLSWPVELKYLTILSLTVAATLLAYEFLVKRTNVTRFLFGMKPKRALTPRNASGQSV